MSLVGSFGLLFVAVALSLSLDASVDTVDGEHGKLEALHQQLGPIPDLGPPRVFSIQYDSTESIHDAYAKDGVVAVRGLIPSILLDKMDRESRELIKQHQARRNKSSQQFYAQHHGAVFLNPPTVIASSDNLTTPKLENVTAFLETALLSKIPIFASKLMLPELQIGEKVRMIRDIFLTRSNKQGYACGWHVDDTGFWPATAASPGISAWIALDDMPSMGGGSFALAVGSHKSSWRYDAQYITGATTFFPADGYQSAADMFANRTGSGTCNIQTSAPHLYRRMEETKRIYNLQKGDVIFHQRWLFHRTVPFEKGYASHKELFYRRYSVRFSPGSAIIPPGYGTELSVLWNEENGNRTADKVCELDGPWYPEVWPATNMEEIKDLKSLVHDKMSTSLERKLTRNKEMEPFLKQAASKQRKSGQHLSEIHLSTRWNTGRS